MTWQQDLQQAISDPAELIALLNLPKERFEEFELDRASFPLRVPRSFVQRMKRGDADDPLLRQILPLGIENEVISGFSKDPVGDMASEVVPGLLHKYHGRALIIATGACGVHCRYCFRREFPYEASSLTRQQVAAAVNYLSADASITEVLLSGGDPLSLSDEKLADLLKKITAIPHIKRIRFHSRQPVVLPSRITDDFCELLAALPQQVIFVVHVNHANELNKETKQAFEKLKMSCDAVLNQSVLLAGVNDAAEILINLSDALFAQGVLPYYLHMLDHVQGASHFYVERSKATQLIETMREHLPGYLVPKLVKEIAGEKAKTPLF